jgi:hypothetical protein
MSSMSQVDFFSSELPPMADLSDVGDSVSGTVKAIDWQDQRDFNDRDKLVTDDAGNVLQVLVLTLETEEGPCRVFVREQTNLKSELARWLRRRKADGIGIGDQLTIEHVGNRGRAFLYAVS